MCSHWTKGIQLEGDSREMVSFYSFICLILHLPNNHLLGTHHVQNTHQTLYECYRFCHQAAGFNYNAENK